MRADIKAGVDFSKIVRIQIIACGTAYYAGSIARYAFEKIAGLPVDVEVASEFRYRTPAMTSGTLAVAVSQSGETADTLAALRWCKEQGLATAALVNVHSSTMAREADLCGRPTPGLKSALPRPRPLRPSCRPVITGRLRCHPTWAPGCCR